MVIEYVTTRLFDSPAQTLVNTVNTVGVMGKGVAADFRRLYPDMFERYRAFCAAGRFQVGQLYLYRTPHKWVLNFPTKVHWRSPSQLQWIEAGLARFISVYSQYGVTSISFPQLGTGNGGLPWKAVRPLMESYLKKVRIPVYVHIRPRDPNFVPEHLSSQDVASLGKDLQAPRREIPFERFVEDIVVLFNGVRVEASDPNALPSVSVDLESSGRSLEIPGENLLDLWQALRLRGAVELSSFPGVMNDKAAVFAERLQTLEYLKPMKFGEDRRPGLRYAPPSATLPPVAIDVLPQ